MSDIYEIIANKMENMSKTQKKIADYILKHRSEISFIKIKDLAARVGVSEASIIRFGNFLGYSGYSELQHLFQDVTQKKLTVKERLEMSYEAYENKDIGDVFHEEIAHLKYTLDNINNENFYQVIDEILAAKRIFIICGRSAYALGYFFQYYLKMILGETYLISHFDGNEDQLISLGKNDLIIGLTFERYTKQTIQLVEYAYKKKAKIVAITDYMTSPIIRYSSCYLLAATKMSTYLDSFVAPLAVINTILTYIGKKKNKKIEQRTAEFEKMWSSMDIFE
ncbi:MAG: hypothetical protein ACFWUC_00120 [Oscillospiraceae bacterium]|jgi:DNA-binding MurR/RpiR family transcriptional regulator